MNVKINTPGVFANEERLSLLIA